MIIFVWLFLVFILYWILDKKDNNVVGVVKSEEYKDVLYIRLMSLVDCDDLKFMVI